MNVRNPRKRVPTAKGRQNNNIVDLPAEPLSGNNSIPRQNVGIDQTNQLAFDPEVGRIFSPIGRQTYFNEEDFNIPFKTYIRMDEDPFEFLTEDLFDNSFSEDSEQTQSESNEEVSLLTIAEVLSISEETPIIKEQNDEQSKGQTEEQVAEPTENEYEESSSQEESSKSLYQNEKTNSVKPLANHPLKPIVEKWLVENKWTGRKLSRTKSKIARFIRFLVSEKVKVPSKDHISLYYQALDNDPNLSFPNSYISTVRVFFRWAQEYNLYEDIAAGVKVPSHSNSRKIKIQRKKWDDGFQTNNQTQKNKPKANITVRDMVMAKFHYRYAEYLINNDLIVFKQWVETLDADSIDAQRKIPLLKFVHFLYSENRTTPTQQDIIDYYKKYLMQMCTTTVNAVMITIRRFFAWTAEKTIYPNIAINIYSTKRKPINADDIPILPDEKAMQPIPNPTRPLINKTI